MGWPKASRNNPEAQEKFTETHICSLLDKLKDETKGLNTANNTFQAPVWTKVVHE